MIENRQGLSAAEAAARLKADGFNELPAGDRRTPLRIAADVLREPMLLLLLCGGGLYLVLGDTGEAMVLLAFAMLSITITIVQETRTERVLDALRDLTSPRALVIRDGERLRIAGRDVVRGDLMVISEGDRTAADGLLISGHDVETDESLLTGESAPVRKRAVTESDGGGFRPGGDDLPALFAGSLVVRGLGTMEVSATGARSEIGKIGQSLKGLETEAPRLQTETRRLVRIFAVIGGCVSVLTIILFALQRGDWIGAALAGIAIGMSMLPQEFPVVLAVFMAMGAWRISKANVLTRRASAIETLGSATVLCTDKTGTLTENRMTIQQLRSPGGEKLILDPSQPNPAPALAPFDALIGCGFRACAPEPFDPMDKAFHRLAATNLGAETPLREPSWILAQSYGLRPDLLAVTQVWRRGPGETMMVAAKGAPEAIAKLCRLSLEDSAQMTTAVNEMAADGLRVLAVAQSEFKDAALPDSQEAFAFTYLGLVGLADPLRASVPKAMADCKAAGLRVVMITGDYPATAAAIARQAGLTTKTIVTGDDLAALSDADLKKTVAEATVFARIMPEQKLRIVQALKAQGEIVAMTGDGVNDAPSLKAANIGVAMGGRGSDVAREASSIVLLDDDFGSIVAAIRLGRRIYDNLRKSMGFIIAVHIPIAGMALLPLLFGLPIILSPVHIAFLEMVIDPVCSLVFEAETEEADVMRRPPRPADAPMFSGAMIAWRILQGSTALAVVAGVLFTGMERGMPENEVRALTFFALVLMTLPHRPNPV